jgi:sugar phosphate isomerase/epimerase
MEKFMIGQYGKFDFGKYKRDYKDRFYGIEACLFNQDEDTINLIQESRKKGFHIGIHFPIRAGHSHIRDALFLSQDDSLRAEAYQYVRHELDYVSKVNPDYILFHYPKPVILDDRVDWSSWHFADPSEFCMETQYPFEELKLRSEQLFHWLTAKGEEYHCKPVLEFDALNPYIYETTFLEELLERHRSIKLCLDTGRLYLQQTMDPYFNAESILRRFAKYAETIHLSTLRVTDKVEYNHYPVLPECLPSEGWAPIERYLQIIRQENQDVKIMFEHRSDLISDEQLEACYQWVDKLLNSVSGEFLLSEL